MVTVLALETGLPLLETGREDPGLDAEGVLLLLFQFWCCDFVTEGVVFPLRGDLGGDGFTTCGLHDLMCISSRPGKKERLQLGHSLNSPGA